MTEITSRTIFCLRSALRFAFWGLLFGGLSTVALAQSTAVLMGTVTDTTGAAVAKANVVIKNPATGVSWTTQTDSSGNYLIASLPVGVYSIEVSAPNFQTSVITNLKLDVATTVSQNIQLKVGAVSQQVVITGEAPLVETATTSVSEVINYKTVQEIPLNGRHFVDLGLMTPGTVTPPANGFLTFPLRGQGSFAINTAGQREDTTNWLVNGVNLNDGVQNQITFQPPIDTVSEFKIDNNSFPAQYGRNSGAIVNIATRSGTNEYHGEAFEFFRNNALDARNFFNTKPTRQAAFKRNDFGADFGGPIVKSKAFFFLAYEGLRQRQGLTVTTIVPSQNQIAGVTSPAVRSLLTVIPPANTPGTDTTGIPANFNGFTGSALAPVSLNQGSADFGVTLTNRDHLHGFYVVQKDLRMEPTANANIPGFGDTREGFRHLATISEDHIFSPTLANTVRAGFNRIHLTFTPNGLFDPAAFNITMPAGSPVGSGLPFINVQGDVNFGGPFGEPQGRGDTTAVFNDTLSWLKGRHSFAFGGEIRRFYNNNIIENIGEFVFTSMANFLNDSGTQFVAQAGSGNDRLVEPSYAGFAQDSFKWKSNFTINVGLRYEWNSTPSEARNRFTNFDLATGTLVPVSQPYHTNNKHFEPRIGFAWDPFNDGKTVVRAAYAIMWQDPVTNIAADLSSNPPFALPIAASSSTNSITLENPSAAVTGLSLGPFGVNRSFNDAYAQDWNLAVERQLNATTGFEVAYVGSKGTHLEFVQNVNQPLVSSGNYGTTKVFPTLPLTSPVLPAQCAPPNPPCVLNSNIPFFNSGGNSNYNALWLTLRKHFSHNFEFLASYTFSKSLDYNSLSAPPPTESIPLQNSYNPRGDYGPSEFDARHRVSLSGFYALPFKGNRLVSGWEMGMFTQAQSGNPITPLVVIAPGTGISLTVRPDVHIPVLLTGHVSGWYADPTIAFTVPCTTTGGVTTCHPGDLSRDAIVGPGFADVDFSLIKNTKLTERFNLQFRTEMFDVVNHPNFGDPVQFITSKAFGRIQSTRFPGGDFGSSRQVQFALKLMF